MLRRFDRHTRILGYCVAAAWTPGCSIYDSALIDGAKGGDSTTEAEHHGSGGMSSRRTVSSGGNVASGGNVSSGGTGGGAPGTGGQSSGGDEATGSMAGSGNGGSSGGDKAEEGCPMDDCCPSDPKKEEPGECGCGVDDDSDGDFTADCNDLCPNEPTKTKPGDCGCGVSVPDEMHCGVLKNGIIHRYSFAGSGAQAMDSVGARHGAIENGGVQSGGGLTFNGIDQYVVLPAGMISSLTNATFEVWFTWNGGGDYQRLVDFGDTQGDPIGGLSYLYVAVSKKGEGPGSGFSLTGKTQFATKTTGTLEIGVQYHLVLVVDGDSKVLSFYVDAAFQSGVAFDGSLSDINDVYGYLGRSLFAGDPYLSGSMDELRIYDVPLSAAQVSYSLAQGPDASLFE